MSFATLNEITGTQAGLSADDQIRLALKTIVAQGGTAPMDAIRNAVAMEVSRLHPGKRLSQQGYDSLRRLVNTNAVRAGYIYPHDQAIPGWRITPDGLEFLKLPVALPEETAVNAATQEQEIQKPDAVRWRVFERHIYRLMVHMHPQHAWYHQGLSTQYERGLDIIGDRVGDNPLHRIGVQVKLHKPDFEPTSAEWTKFLAGCFVRRVNRGIFVTSGSLNSKQRREAGEGDILIIAGREEVDRLSTHYGLPPFDLYDDPDSVSP